MNKEEALIQDEIFFSLMQDALIISEEIKDLEYYLELDAETPTINEYQIFKTLYLKRKIALCLERLESLKEEQGLACSNALADTTRAQFLSLKQIIDTLDMVNQSREISMIYTKEEAEYIKECEDKREKSNPEVKQYPIKTRLTFAIYKTKEELSTEQRNKLRRLRLGTIASRIIFGVGLLVTLVTGHFIIALIIGICLLLIGLQYPVDKEQLLRKSKVKLATQASIENARFMERKFNLGIKDLQTASIEYSGELKSYKSYLYTNSKEEKKELGKYVSHARRGFNQYEDYETYVDLVLLCEKLNPILVAKGIIYQTEKDIEELIKKQSSGFIVFRGRLPGARSNSFKVKTREEKKVYRSVKQPVQRSNKSYNPIKGQQYSSTKVTPPHFSSGRKGR